MSEFIINAIKLLKIIIMISGCSPAGASQSKAAPSQPRYSHHLLVIKLSESQGTNENPLGTAMTLPQGLKQATRQGEGL